MSVVIDRRPNPKDKSLGNRQRFIRRAKEQVKKAVRDAVGDMGIKDINEKKVKVPVKGIDEPTFEHDHSTGKRKIVIPGNKDFVEGDVIDKPMQGGGVGSGGDNGEDEFVFTLTRDEFLDFFFEDLELPNLVEKKLRESVETSPARAGYTPVGNPANLSVAQTFKRALGRRLALHRPKQYEIEELEDEYIETLDPEVLALLDRTRRRRKGIPFIDKVDLRYKNYIQQPKPNQKAVMLCLMDVSGSMGEREKDIAKRFFLLLYLLLYKRYKTVEIVFIRYHSEAYECTEHEFFYGRETGGTEVAEGYRVVEEAMQRYPSSDYNLYLCQCSDGDVGGADDVHEGMTRLERILPRVQYMTYLDIPRHPDPGMIYGVFGVPVPGSRGSDILAMLEPMLKKFENLAVAVARNEKEIWPVFRKLFQKESA